MISTPDAFTLPCASRRHFFALLTLIVASIVWASTPTSANAAHCPPGCRKCCIKCSTAQFDIWLFSSRCLPACCDMERYADKVHVCHFVPGEGWASSTTEAFLATDDPAVPTVVLVHGSPASHEEVVALSMDVIENLRCRSPDGAVARVVIWSWPSDKQCLRIIKDFRAKMPVADAHGYYLARFLSRINPQVEVTLAGYSFGSRTVCSALHLLAGGKLCGCPTPDMSQTVDPARKYSVVLLAGGIDNDAICPGSCYERALISVDEMLVSVNCRDPLLKRYHLLYCLKSDASAIGFTGVACASCVAPLGDRYREIDVTCDVGKSHDICRYLESDALVDAVLSMVFAPGGTAAPAEEVIFPASSARFESNEPALRATVRSF